LGWCRVDTMVEGESVVDWRGRVASRMGSWQSRKERCPARVSGEGCGVISCNEYSTSVMNGVVFLDSRRALDFHYRSQSCPLLLL
jgi:hypothetical protein